MGKFTEGRKSSPLQFLRLNNTFRFLRGDCNLTCLPHFSHSDSERLIHGWGMQVKGRKCDKFGTIYENCRPIYLWRLLNY